MRTIDSVSASTTSVRIRAKVPTFLPRSFNLTDSHTCISKRHTIPWAWVNRSTPTYHNHTPDRQCRQKHSSPQAGDSWPAECNAIKYEERIGIGDGSKQTCIGSARSCSSSALDPESRLKNLPNFEPSDHLSYL